MIFTDKTNNIEDMLLKTNLNTSIVCAQRDYQKHICFAYTVVLLTYGHSHQRPPLLLGQISDAL